MDEIPVSKFKAHCAEVLDEVARTGRCVTITKRGKAVAEVRPPSPPRSVKRKLGFLAGELGDYDDIVEPSGAFSDAEILAEWAELNAWADPSRRRRPAS